MANGTGHDEIVAQNILLLDSSLVVFTSGAIAGGPSHKVLEATGLPGSALAGTFDSVVWGGTGATWTTTYAAKTLTLTTPLAPVIEEEEAPGDD